MSKRASHQPAKAAGVEWDKVFEGAQPKPGASEEEIAQFVATVGQPLSAEEVDYVNRSQRNPWPASNPFHATWRPFDPLQWQMPNRPLPASYLSFLRWSNAGHFQNGGRLFQMFGTGLRNMMISYNMPQYMPGALPFAFNGGGVFYLFDMRAPAVGGEYPIHCAHAGSVTCSAKSSATRCVPSPPTHPGWRGMTALCRRSPGRSTRAGASATCPSWPTHWKRRVALTPAS